MQKRTLTQIKKALQELSKKGWIKSLRKHNTGIGKTLESYLNLKENNIALPDFGKLELKSQRLESASLITLFTKKPDNVLNSKILDRFGYPREKDGLYVLHQTITSGRSNKQGFRLKNIKQKLSILKKGKYIFSYDKDKLRKLFDRKVGKGVIIALATSQKDGKGKERFHYKEAYILKAGNFNKFLENLFYDIRIGRYPDGRPHDHGSAFRVKKTALPNIFKVYRRLI